MCPGLIWRHHFMNVSSTCWSYWDVQTKPGFAGPQRTSVFSCPVKRIQLRYETRLTKGSTDWLQVIRSISRYMLTLLCTQLKYFHIVVTRLCELITFMCPWENTWWWRCVNRSRWECPTANWVICPIKKLLKTKVFMTFTHCASE